MDAAFEPKILAFLCNWCAYAGADLAGVSRLQYPPGIRVIRVMCSGRVDPLFVINGLQKGFDSVFVSGWHMGECHYLEGNVHAEKELAVAAHLLKFSGIGAERLCLRWVSAAEGQLFAEYVSEYTERTRKLGPFDAERFRSPLAAAEAALTSPRLRWLMGMEVQVTERGNVYGQKQDESGYHRLLRAAAEEEYQKALVLNALKSGPRTVRDIALESGLPVYTVSLRLGELERARAARFHQFDGRTPTFAARA